MFAGRSSISTWRERGALLLQTSSQFSAAKTTPGRSSVTFCSVLVVLVLVLMLVLMLVLVVVGGSVVVLGVEVVGVVLVMVQAVGVIGVLMVVVVVVVIVGSAGCDVVVFVGGCVVGVVVAVWW